MVLFLVLPHPQLQPFLSLRIIEVQESSDIYHKTPQSVRKLASKFTWFRKEELISKPLGVLAFTGTLFLGFLTFLPTYRQSKMFFIVYIKGIVA